MNSKCESVGLIDQKEFGIPIPKSNRRNYDNSSQQSSPGSGFFCGSPISPSQIYSAGNATPTSQLGVFSARISRAASPQPPTIVCPDHQRLGICGLNHSLCDFFVYFFFSLTNFLLLRFGLN